MSLICQPTSEDIKHHFIIFINTNKHHKPQSISGYVPRGCLTDTSSGDVPRTHSQGVSHGHVPEGCLTETSSGDVPRTCSQGMSSGHVYRGYSADMFPGLVPPTRLQGVFRGNPTVCPTNTFSGVFHGHVPGGSRKDMFPRGCPTNVPLDDGSGDCAGCGKVVILRKCSWSWTTLARWALALSS